MVATTVNADAEVDALVDAAKRLRIEFAATAAEVDARGEMPLANLQRIHELGFNRFLVPRALGGIVERPSLSWKVSALNEMLTEISAGENSTAQVWMVHTGVVRKFFADMVDLPRSTLEQIASEVMNEGARFISSVAEPNKKRLSFTTSGRRVPGGLLVRGTKYFGTGSTGARYANVPLLLAGYESVEAGGLYFAIVRMDAPGVVLHHDWDNMGQRATVSQTVIYEDVFVPDGWHYGLRGGADAFYAPDVIVGPVAQMSISAVILGMGLGAFDAVVDYVAKFTRPADPRMEDATEDPIIRWQVGKFSAQLAAARALQREYAAALEAYDGDPAERGQLSIQMMRSKVMILEAVLNTAGDLHRLAGGRATANKYRLDRFWRNARTLSVHDGIDQKLQSIGVYELTGNTPPVTWLT
jgi:alkylation response protein AidB-like acyl-CoA dehydrogenase